MKTNAIIRIVLFSVLIAVLTAVLAGSLAFHSFHVASWDWDTVQNSQIVSGGNQDGSQLPPQNSPDNSQLPPWDWDDDAGNSQVVTPTGPSSSSYSLPVTTISELEIQWIAGTISVAYSEGDTLEISETENPKEPMVCRQVGNKLVVQFCRNKLIGPATFQKDLTIRIPRNWVPMELQIDTVSADLDMSGITLNELEVDSVSAKCTLTDCTADSVSLETVSGDIFFSGTLRELSCSAVSGHCAAKLNSTPYSVELEGLSGTLELGLPADCTGFRTEMEKATGQFVSDFPVTRVGRDYRYGDGMCLIEIEGLAGNVAIRKNP